MNYDVKEDLEIYNDKVKKFDDQFKTNLTKQEIALWKEKVKKTKIDVVKAVKSHSQEVSNNNTKVEHDTEAENQYKFQCGKSHFKSKTEEVIGKHDKSVYYKPVLC